MIVNIDKVFDHIFRNYILDVVPRSENIVRKWRFGKFAVNSTITKCMNKIENNLLMISQDVWKVELWVGAPNWKPENLKTFPKASNSAKLCLGG